MLPKQKAKTMIDYQKFKKSLQQLELQFANYQRSADAPIYRNWIKKPLPNR